MLYISGEEMAKHCLQGFSQGIKNFCLNSKTCLKDLVIVGTTGDLKKLSSNLNKYVVNKKGKNTR